MCSPPIFNAYPLGQNYVYFIKFEAACLGIKYVMPHNSETCYHVDSLQECLNMENLYLLDEF
jgi:hypothetical protein